MSDQKQAYEFDNIDKGILNALMEDVKTPYTRIAQNIFVSDGTVHVRMKN